MSKFDIATEMNGIMASPAYRSVFAKPEPQFAKTAAKKEDADDKAKAKAKAEAEKEKEKAAKEKAKEKAEAEKAKEKAKAEKEKAKAKADKEKSKKKAMTKYEACVYSLCKASEILDEVGLGKASALTLQALDSLVTTAAKKKEEKGKDKKKEEADKKKKEDKVDDKGLPPWLNKKKEEKGKKDEKKPEKKDDKKKDVKKKASDEINQDCEGCGDMAMAEDDIDLDTLMAPDEDGNLPAEEESTVGEDLPKPEMEGLEGPELGESESFEDENEPAPEGVLASSKKTSLQKLAEELGKNFLA